MRANTEALAFIIADLIDKDTRNYYTLAYRSPNRPAGLGILPHNLDRVVVNDGTGPRGDIILTRKPLPPSLLYTSDLIPANTEARQALANEIAPLVTENGGIVLLKPGTDRGLIITRSAKYSAGFQLTHFDSIGFAGDHEIKSLAEGLREAGEGGYVKLMSEEWFTRIIQTDRFAAGDELTTILNMDGTTEEENTKLRSRRIELSEILNGQEFS